MTITRRFRFVEDSQLVELAQRGSLEAYDELVSRFRDAVILVVRQTVRSLTLEAAQDVAQETFVLAFRSGPVAGHKQVCRLAVYDCAAAGAARSAR